MWVFAIQILQEKRLEFFILCGFYKGKSWNLMKFVLKLCVYSKEILNLDNLLVAANLNL